MPPGAASNAATSASLVPFLHQTDVGIERNTASVDYRWTPTDAWDVRADYSHMDRTGTQAAGVVGFQTGTSVYESPTQVAAPVNDTTQNFGTNGEYLGTSPWGQRFTFKAAYSGSLYTDNIANYSVQSPYCSGTTFGQLQRHAVKSVRHDFDAAEQRCQRGERNAGGRLAEQKPLRRHFQLHHDAAECRFPADDG